MSSLTRSGARSSSAASSSRLAGRPRRASSPAALLLEPCEVVGGVDGQADGAARVGDAALDRLTDPPGRVRGELEALAPVELLDRVDEAEVALLDQVEERHARRLVALGDRDDESQVRLDELALCVFALADELLEVTLLGTREALVDGVEGLACSLTGFDVLGEAGFVVLGQQLVPTDVFQIQANEVLVVPFCAVSYSCHSCLPRGLRVGRSERSTAVLIRTTGESFLFRSRRGMFHVRGTGSLLCPVSRPPSHRNRSSAPQKA